MRSRALAALPIDVALPDDALAPGERGTVRGNTFGSVYGTRGAALNSSLQYIRVVLALRFENGSSGPGNVHAKHEIRATVNGDDFILEGTLTASTWIGRALREQLV